MHYLWIAMVTASLSLPAVAAVEQSLQQCAQIGQDAQRLACYDQLSASLKSPSTQVNAATPNSPVVASTAPTQAAPTATAAIARFGAKPVEVVQEPEAIELTIASISQSARGNLIISFDNGQVWKQLEAKRYRLAAGDKVQIKKAALGSYLLQAEGRNRSIRVQREQ